MNWLCLFLCVCLILQSLHFGVRMNRVEKSMKNWAQEAADVCNASLNQLFAAYRSSVVEWLNNEFDKRFDEVMDKKCIDDYVDTVKINLNENE